MGKGPGTDCHSGEGEPKRKVFRVPERCVLKGRGCAGSPQKRDWQAVRDERRSALTAKGFPGGIGLIRIGNA